MGSWDLEASEQEGTAVGVNNPSGTAVINSGAGSGAGISFELNGSSYFSLNRFGFYIGVGLMSAAAAAVTNPVVTSGVAFTPGTLDTNVYIPIISTTTGTVTITMGPTTGTENTIITGNLVALSSQLYTLHVPNGWKVVVTITGTTVSIGTVTVVVD